MTRPTLDLFPEPGEPSSPPTWDDIERLARHYPAAHRIVTLVDRGYYTREQATIALVFWFATAFARQFKHEADALATETLDTIFQAECGCVTSRYLRRRVVEMLCETHRPTGEGT